jgi:hypothetical protein
MQLPKDLTALHRQVTAEHAAPDARHEHLVAGSSGQIDADPIPMRHVRSAAFASCTAEFAYIRIKAPPGGGAAGHARRACGARAPVPRAGRLASQTLADHSGFIGCGPPPSSAPSVPDGIAASRPSRYAVDYVEP